MARTTWYGGEGHAGAKSAGGGGRGGGTDEGESLLLLLLPLPLPFVEGAGAGAGEDGAVVLALFAGRASLLGALLDFLGIFLTLKVCLHDTVLVKSFDGQQKTFLKLGRSKSSSIICHGFAFVCVRRRFGEAFAPLKNRNFRSSLNQVSRAVCVTATAKVYRVDGQTTESETSWETSQAVSLAPVRLTDPA